MSSFLTNMINKNEPQKRLTQLQATFTSWLLSRGHNETYINIIIESINEISKYAISARKVRLPLLEMDTAGEIKKATNNLTGDKAFKIKDKQAGEKYTSAFNLLMKFLKTADFTAIQQDEVCNKATAHSVEFIDIEQEYINKPESLIEVIIKKVDASNETAFYDWLIKYKSLAPITAKNYVSCINSIGTIVPISKSLFAISSLQELVNIKSSLFVDPVFIQKNISCHNSYTAAFNNYYMFLMHVTSEDNIVSQQIAVVNKNTNKAIKSAKVYFNSSNTLLNPCELAAKTILDDFFQNGIKVNSNIQLRKFAIQFTSIYSDVVLPESVDEIKEIISRVAIDCSECLFITTKNIATDAGLVYEIINYIIKLFTDGKKIVYVENVYNHFKERLIDTNIHNKNVLMCLIKHFLKEDVVYKGDAILINADEKLNIEDEVLKVLSGSDMPLSKQEIYTELPHLLPNKIEMILKTDKRSVYISRNVYWHIDKFEISDDDTAILEDVIRYEIHDGFISVKKLLDILSNNMPDFIQKNNVVNHVTLRDLLKYNFDGKFGFQYTFIGKLGEEMTGVVAVNKYFREKNSFTLNELIQFVEDNDLPQQSELFINELNSFFVRINEQDFIKKATFKIDVSSVSKISKIIEKHLNGGFVAFSQIKRFTIFPYIDYNWNLFLLESIIENFCPEYEIVRFSHSVKKCTGIVVDKRKGCRTFDDILIEVLSQQDKYCPLSSVADALNYLFEQNYIAQRRYKNIDYIYNSVKQKNR